MILFNRWIISRVDRAVRLAEPMRIVPPTQDEQSRNYAAKSYAFGVGPKPVVARCRVCRHDAHRIECRYENRDTDCACEYVKNPEYVQ